ncbi:MAG: ribose-5-phosphate isomerase A, partial [Elainellaceae cyanobacterium]
MAAETDPKTLMKQEVGRAAADRVSSDSIVGLGTGSTTAFAIQYLGERLQSGSLKNIKGVTTSFQAIVLARQYGIPVVSLDEIDRIDGAIDGAAQVDAQKSLIIGGGGARTQDEFVDALAEGLVGVVGRGMLGGVLGGAGGLRGGG